MGLVKAGIVSLCALLGMGCAGVAKIESTVRKGPVQKIDRAYVLLVASATGSGKFLAGLKPEIEQKFKMHNAACKAHIYDNLGLDEKATIRKEVEEFKPRYVLTIAQVSKTIFQGREGEAAFELTLQEPGSESLVWKANLKTEDGFWVGAPSSVGAPDVTAEAIVKQLIRDGLMD